MNTAVLLRLIIYTPLIASAGVYCWRHGIRWSRTVTITGWPAKVAAVFLFAAAGVMLLSVIFPQRAEQIVDSLDQKFGGPPKHRAGG